jgi:NADH-quinone oxidoreductase subunit E
MSQLLKKYPQEIEHILGKYPPEQKQPAVMPLLHLAQRDAGYVSRAAIQEITEITGLSTTEVSSVIGFYTLYRDKPGGRIRIQVCTDLACDLRGAKEYLGSLCQQLGVKSGETSNDGMITIEEVKCLAACDKAPMFQSQIGDQLEYHENQTPEKTLDWVRSMTASMASASPKTAEGEGGSHE